MFVILTGSKNGFKTYAYCVHTLIPKACESECQTGQGGTEDAGRLKVANQCTLK